MKRVDQHRTIIAPGVFDDALGLHKIASIGPGHELQMRMQPIRRCQITERGKVFRHALFVRIVTGHEQFSGTEFRADSQNFLEVGDDGVRFQTQDINIQNAYAGITQTRQGLTAQFAIGLRISVQDGAPSKLKVKCSISKTITDEIESQVDDPEQMKLL